MIEEKELEKHAIERPLQAVVRLRCESCGQVLHPSSLTRVGIGVYHYDRDKDCEGDGLLNCGLVK